MVPLATGEHGEDPRVEGASEGDSLLLSIVTVLSHPQAAHRTVAKQQTKSDL